MFVTGSYSKITGAYTMNVPNSYFPVVYVGYNFEQMKKQYRKDYNLKYKRIEWIIVGKEIENNDN